MPDAPRERKPWERLPGEGTKQYDAFKRYRGLGGDRSIRRAVSLLLAEKSPRCAHQRRYLTHPNPRAYEASVVACWKRWSAYWQWVGRCRSYDEHIDEQARAAQEESDRRAKLDEIAEKERQAKSRIATVRVGRETAARLLQKIAKALTPGGELEKLPAKDLVPHLAKIATLLDKCLTHERYEERRADPSEGLSLSEVPVEQMSDEEILERIRFAFSARPARTDNLVDGSRTPPTASAE